ncbi:MAG TPA: beta-lactamase family protein, partial [Dehalococcoidia bacterium]|nr:beta-lactamase family protein [Dehalococcoidia bacterium]
MKKIAIPIVLILALVASILTGCTTPPAPPTTGSLEQRLERLVEQLEQQRQALHIPGMAIAVVKDDEVILAQGFGVADIEKETPVTPQTIFAIGSSTKAFTATLVGMLVDEGKMDWDDPVTDYLPYFTLDIESEDENAEATIRDLLSHRTGFCRMGLLFASGELPREEVLHAATAAEPFTGFREKFYYSNVMYMAAGVAAG